MKKLLKQKTKKVLSGATALTMVLGLSGFVATPASAAISAMSVTGTGITADSAAVSTAIKPTVNFTTGSDILSSDTLLLTINGVASTSSIESVDVTQTGCTGTLALTTIGSAVSNPTFEISGLACPAGALTFTVQEVSTSNSVLTTTATSDNYAISLTTPYETGSFFFYVGDENIVQVRALVESSLAFTIRNAADTANQGNVAGGLVGPNLCDLGTLTTTAVNTCDYRLKVSTNANSYTVSLLADGTLRSGARNIDDITEDSTNVTLGTEGYGITVAGGASTEDGVTVTEAGTFSDDDSPVPNIGALSLITVDGPNSPAATDTTNTTLVTHRAAIDAATAAGLYTQLVTYTVSATY
jgi:hypothetical protein